ncbi:unnamed protein product [Pieris macdunnoughi]|uniref:U3 small nucleolar RNA-associated protein 13 C-terminal domain-containing protein n=1 Tax=Pieris macdunnoughi TaxID=345717 RepID=A0A821WA54_9NEOP|nr:unnamed protein product [Pieris macdunnoughi]
MAVSMKEIYEKTSEYEAFYTGGDIQWTRDGANFLCQCDDIIKFVDLNTLCNTITIGASGEDSDENDVIYTFQLSHDNKTVVTAHKSGLIKLWDSATGILQKSWRSGHKGAVAKLAYDMEDINIASASSDGNIRLWDLVHYTCTSSLKGAMGVFSVLKYHPDPSKQLIFGAADDTKIRSWDAKTGKESNIYSGHFSKVTSIQFTFDGNYMVSSGRDRVLILWKISEGKSIRVLPVYECIETMILLPQTFKIPNFTKKVDTQGIYVACAGEKGLIKIWNIEMSRLMYEQSNSLVSPASDESGLAVMHLLFNEARNMLSVITADHNIIIHDLETFNCMKQITGFSDEVLDIIFLGNDDTHIVVATNSRDLKYYTLDNMDCKLIKGHTDIVLALAKFPTNKKNFISSGKDNSVRIWKIDELNEIKCFGVGKRHTGSVGAVCTSQITCSFFTSVSQDNCLKVWAVPMNTDQIEQTLQSSHTELAHNMDINCVAVSPNDKIVGTGSQDKTAKLWTEDLTMLGTLKGHRRGVWCVKFSPVDQVVLTSSADSSIKLWSIADLSCLKTFEGHESSVLKIEFLSKGQQILSTGADGLLKLWTIKTSECKMSLDNHDGKVWSLAVSNNESLVITGGSDSKLVTLKDVSAERREKMLKEREELILQEQELMNLLHDKKLVKALKLAIRMDRPLHVLKIVNEVLKFGSDKLSQTLKEINNTQKETLLKFAAEWNTNTKNCHAAQLVFNILAPEIISGQLQVPSLARFIEGALPYTERHFERLTNLLQDLNFISYTVNCMQPHCIKN